MTKDRGVKTVRAIIALFALSIALMVFTATPAHAVTGDNYPTTWKNAPMGSLLDTWKEANRYCTSWVAWALHDRNAYELPFNDDAIGFADKARALKITVDATPGLGSVAWWGAAEWNGGYGHVAYVDSISDDTVTVSEYNFRILGGYDTRTIAKNNPSAYIHFKDLLHPRHDIAWYDGSAIWGFQAPGMATATGAFGYSAPRWAGSGDYNHDGKDDLYWYDQNSSSIYLLPGDHFAYARALRGPGVGPPVWAAVGDFSGDGYRDEIAWYDGNGLFLFSKQGLATIFSVVGYTAPTWAGVGDYNRDGKDDLYWYLGGNDGSIYVLTSTGTGFNGAVRVRGPGIGAPQWAGVGDFDGDHHRNDIAWYSGGMLFTFAGPSLGTTSAIAGYSAPAWAGVGDYNADGKDDLYWYLANDAGSASGTIYAIPSNGSGFNAARSVRGPGIGRPIWAGTGDYNP